MGKPTADEVLSYAARLIGENREKLEFLRSLDDSRRSSCGNTLRYLYGDEVTGDLSNVTPKDPEEFRKTLVADAQEADTACAEELVNNESYDSAYMLVWASMKSVTDELLSMGV